jgi:hypothetical protein
VRYEHETGNSNKNLLNEAYNRFRVSKHMFVVFPITNGVKKGNVLLPLLFKFALENVFRMFEVKQDD